VNPYLRAIAIVTIYIATLFAVIFGLPLLKELITGSVGPMTIFVSHAVIAPAAFLILGLYFGQREFAFHVMLVVAMVFFVFLTYPDLPLLNFQREIAFTTNNKLLLLYVLVAFISAKKSTLPTKSFRSTALKF